MHSKYLIIGASAAAIGALSKLRNLDPSASITCVTAEKEMPYNRCLLADMVAGSRPEGAIYTRKQDFFEKNNITLLRSTRVTAIDAESKTVQTAAGESVSYDKLFLGTGKSAFVPPIPGSTAHNVVPFFDLKDANKVKQLAQQPEVNNVVVIGAGLTGLECADALTDYVSNITVVEQGPHVLPTQIDPQGAVFIEKLATQVGITVVTNTSIINITTQQNKATAVTLSNGTTLPADIVVLATGGKPNVDLAKQAGLATQDGGLVVNDYMQTSDQSIFSGGDICLVNDLLTGQKTLSCLWPDAARQGMVAAQNMVHAGATTYPGALLVTSSTIFDTTFVTCGPVTQAHQYQALVKHDTTFYHRLMADNQGRLQGFIMVGNIAGVGQLRKALLEKQVIMPPTKGNKDEKQKKPTSSTVI